MLINENLAAKARIIRDSLGKAGARVVVESTSVFTNKGKVAAHLKVFIDFTLFCSNSICVVKNYVISFNFMSY